MNTPLRKRCDILVTALVGKDYVEQWWDSPNLRFDGETPRKLFDSDPNRVYNYLLEFAEGTW